MALLFIKTHLYMLVLFMHRIRLSEENFPEALRNSVDILNNGGIVSYPTETFYGLGAKFDREDSLQKLYEIKQRSDDKALPIIIGSRESLSHIVLSINDKAVFLMNRFWPGPLTIVLRAKENLSSYITAGTHSVAVRIPGESFALRLAQYAGFPITATSANPSGKTPAHDAKTVCQYFGDRIDLIIDGGVTKGTLPSTIVDATGKDLKILREGMITKKQILQMTTL